MALKTLFDAELAQGTTLPYPVAYTQNEYLKGVLAELNSLQADPITQRAKPKSETGVPVAETRERIGVLQKSLDDIYDEIPAGAAAQAPTGRRTSERYAPAFSGGDLRKTDGAAVGQAQSMASVMLNTNRFDNSKMGQDPDLSYDEEARYLEAFAKDANVEVEDVAVNPRLYEAFGRYLGMATGTLNNEKYWAFDLEGKQRQDADGNNYKAWTPWVQPRFVSEVAGIGSTIASNKLAARFRGNEKQFVKEQMAAGASRETAELAWKQAGELDTDQSVFARDEIYQENDPSSNLSIVDPIVNKGMRLTEQFHKTFQNFMRDAHRQGPNFASRFAEKIAGNRYSDFTAESYAEMVALFLSTYAALEEKSPGAGRAWADMMFLSVMDHSLRNVYRYEQKKGDPETKGSITEETTEEAQKRFDKTLMTGAADEVAIGTVIFENMGFTNANQEQKAAMGAMAMDMVFKTFRKSSRNEEHRLFEKRETKAMVDGVKRTYIGHTFTSAGLGIAQDMHALFAAVMPKSRRNVRYGNLVTKKTNIRKLAGAPVGKPVLNKKTNRYELEDEFAETVPFGDTAAAARQQQQADNTPVTIHDPSVIFWTQLYQDYQNSGYELGYGQETVMGDILAELDGSNFFNIKGNGANYKGTFRDRPGYVYVTDRKGRLYHKDSPHLLTEDGSGEVVYTNRNGLSTEEAATKGDFSDKIKDHQFLDTIQFAADNRKKIFYYTYLYGKNWRLNVDQTVGNYQHNKFARSLIAAGVPATYSLNKKYDVIVLKAGIMKRFGFDSLNPIMAAKEYDSVIDKWMALENDRPGILREAGKEEGFASVAAILEGINFKKALDKPNQPIYVSNFFTEIDGKTNGLAHAAAQSGDMSNAAGALIFDDEDYATWNKYYDELAPLVAAEDVKAIRDLAIEKKIDPSVFENFLDAYHKVNNQLLKNFLDIKTGKDAQGNAVTFPGMISQNATEAFKQIMQTAQDRGGLEKFKRALEIFDKSRLGRKFTKKPVMIFAYGAGDARHADEVKSFIDAILRRDGVEFQQLFDKEGIDIDKDFIDPLGVMMAEAVNKNFKQIKKFANALSAAGMEALKQGFDLFIPTMDGQLVPIGDLNYWMSVKPGDRRQQKYTLPDGMESTVVAHKMDRAWDFSAGKELLNGVRIFKAATQMAVMLTHANDNINMQRALGIEHDNKVADRIAELKSRITNAKDTATRMRLTDERVALENHETPYGNTALHIFDGLLVTPMEAEQYAGTLNKVFKDMNSDPEWSHMQAIYNALTYDLDSNGQKIPDPNFKQHPKYNENMNEALRAKYFYRRRLKPEGEEEADIRNLSTWDPQFDRQVVGGRTVRPSLAFDWNIKGFWKGDKYFPGSKDIYQTFFGQLGMDPTKRGGLVQAKRAFEANKSHYHQFFWSTDDTMKQIKEYVDDLTYMTKTSKGNPRK